MPLGVSWRKMSFDPHWGRLTLAIQRPSDRLVILPSLFERRPGIGSLDLVEQKTINQVFPVVVLVVVILVEMPRAGEGYSARRRAT